MLAAAPAVMLNAGCAKLLAHYSSSSSLRQALAFAAEVHAGQLRKYGDGPYLGHPVAVALRMASLGLAEDYAILGLLHDVREHDASVTFGDLEARFGLALACDVDILTNMWDASVPLMPRADRKALYTEQLRLATVRAQTIKLADIEDNLPGIVANDPLFAAVYLSEKRVQFQVLTAAPVDLRAAVRELLATEAERL